MRKNAILLACAAMLVSVVSCPAFADTFEDVKARGKLICGVLTGYEPYSYQDPATRQLVGYEIDFCAALARDLGVQFEPKVVTTQGRIPEITQGRVDVLAARISYTKERAEQVDYTGLYDRVSDRFIVLASSGLSATDIKPGTRFGVSKGTPLEQFLRDKYPQSSVVSFDDISLAYAALRSGKVDAVLAPTTTLIALQNRDAGSNATKVLPDVIYKVETSFIIRKGEDRMRSAIDAFLAKAEQSGLASQIYEKYFGAQSAYKLPRDFAVGCQPS